MSTVKYGMTDQQYSNADQAWSNQKIVKGGPGYHGWMFGYAAALNDAKLSNDELLAKIKVTQEKYRKIREERAKEKK